MAVRVRRPGGILTGKSGIYREKCPHSILIYEKLKKIVEYSGK